MASSTLFVPTCRLCLLQYEKEVFTPTAFMDLFSKLNAMLSDEQLSVFAGEKAWLRCWCHCLFGSQAFGGRHSSQKAISGHMLAFVSSLIGATLVLSLCSPVRAAGRVLPPPGRVNRLHHAAGTAAEAGAGHAQDAARWARCAALYCAVLSRAVLRRTAPVRKLLQGACLAAMHLACGQRSAHQSPPQPGRCCGKPDCLHPHTPQSSSCPLPAAAELTRTAGRGSQVVTRLSTEVLAAVKKALEPESVAAIRELRAQPWKEALADHQAQQGQQAQQAQQQQQQQPAAEVTAAPPAAAAKPALQPRAVKPLVAAGGGGSLLGAALGGAAAAAAAKPALQPRAVKPLAVGSSMFGAAVQSPAQPAAPAAEVTAADAAPEAAPSVAEEDATPAAEPAAAAAAPAVVAKPGLQAKQVKPLGLQQKPAVGGLFGSSNSGAQARQPAAAVLLGRGAPSAAGSLLGASGAGSTAAAAAAAAVKASFALPFSFAANGAAAPAAAAAAPQAAQQLQQQQQQEGEQKAQAAQEGAAAGGQSQRDAIRAAVEAMRAEQPAAGEEQQPGDAAAEGSEEEAEGQAEQQQQQGRAEKQQKGGSDALDEFMPLPVSEKYGKGAVKRRAAAEPDAADGGGAGGGSNAGAAGKKKAKKGREAERHLKQTMVELGLEGGSDLGMLL